MRKLTKKEKFGAGALAGAAIIGTAYGTNSHVRAFVNSYAKSIDGKVEKVFKGLPFNKTGAMSRRKRTAIIGGSTAAAIAAVGAAYWKVPQVRTFIDGLIDKVPKPKSVNMSKVAQKTNRRGLSKKQKALIGAGIGIGAAGAAYQFVPGVKPFINEWVAKGYSKAKGLISKEKPGFPKSESLKILESGREQAIARRPYTTYRAPLYIKG